VFRRAVDDLKSAGAEIVDNIVIADLRPLLAKRVIGPDFDANIKWYFRHPNAPFKSRQELIRAPQFEKVAGQARNRLTARTEVSESEHYQYLLAREELMLNVLKVMADHQLDALVYKSIEHEPPLLMDGLRGIATNRGVPSMNTYLIYVPAITVPAGFTNAGIPVGITFQGRPYADGEMIKFAYGYEQATHHRRPPSSVPAVSPR
jgi:Asp-tRNA(Asn)/Glu-tRNA(Gln) amidotransferase A subunit family amidase